MRGRKNRGMCEGFVFVFGSEGCNVKLGEKSGESGGCFILTGIWEMTASRRCDS